jgi:hypothetical protein
LCDRAPIFHDIKVIDPIYLFRSKCHCFMGLPQGDRQDERHVRMLALILPEYISLLIDESDRGNIPDRDLLKEIKLLKKKLIFGRLSTLYGVAGNRMRESHSVGQNRSFAVSVIGQVCTGEEADRVKGFATYNLRHVALPHAMGMVLHRWCV